MASPIVSTRCLRDYARTLEILNYPNGMTRSYERWQEVNENHERDLKRSGKGLFPVRVVIYPDKFLTWCAARAIEPSMQAIDIFIGEAAGYT
jgi:hypothetical protein